MIEDFLVHGVDRYRIDFRAKSDGTFDLIVLERPADPYRRSDVSAHILSGNRICVAAGHEPRTLDRAKAVGMMWMSGYSTFIRDRQGVFPNKACKVNI